MYGRGPNPPANGPPGPGGPGAAPTAAPAGPGGVGPGPVKTENPQYNASYNSNGYGGVSAFLVLKPIRLSYVQSYQQDVSQGYRGGYSQDNNSQGYGNQGKFEI